MLIDASRPLILGSGSPRRRDIVTALGLPFRIVPAEIDESDKPGEEPLEYLQRITAEKLRGVDQRLAATPHAAVLVADTIVVIDGVILGKPTDRAHAVQLFSRIAGRTHSVFTRYELRASEGEKVVARTVETRVTMRPASASEIEAYAATDEGHDKAGAYAAQGVGTFFIERIEGSYSNVIGLPACELLLDLRALGLVTEALPVANKARG
jgi:septum formation protein